LQTESKLRGDRAFFLIPKPSEGLDFEIKNVDFYNEMFFEKMWLFGLSILLSNLRSFKLVSRKLKTTPIDLFVLRVRRTCVFVPIYLSALRQRYVIKTLGNIYNFQVKQMNIKSRIYYLFHRRILGRVLSKASFIDVCTTQFYNNYRKVYQLRNIGIIENAVNTDRFFPLDRDECKRKCGLERFEKIVGYCGGYPSQRGGRQLVEISSKLIERYPGCGLLIVGDDAELENIKKKADESGVKDHIIFTGVVNYEKLPVYMNCLDVGVGLPSRERVYSQGSSSQKIRQYLACGIPVILPKYTNEKIIEHGLGTAVATDDTREILEAVSYYLDKTRGEVDTFRKEASEYAKSHLSTRFTYMQRYTAWISSLKTEGVQPKEFTN
jgi:glycosyltransferase involved in cell wall biosynthesis